MTGETYATVRLECCKQLGYALVYMKYLNPNVCFCGQDKRVKKLCKQVAKLESRSIVRWQSELNRIHAEIENMC